MDGIRISLYIVTYRNPIDLNRNIASILASGADVRIHVINNHSQFSLDPAHDKAVTVLHNHLRPDFSTGHLAINWNQALLHGFRDLNNPTSDIVVTAQDDVLFKADWLGQLVELHRRYNFITMGVGDAFCSYLPEAVKKVGLWDERFCNIGFQEGDYFLRSLIYNKEGCSINDVGHGRQNNALKGNVVHCWPELSAEKQHRCESLLITSPPHNRARMEAQLSSLLYHPFSAAMFYHKWGVAHAPWTAEHHTVRSSLIKSYVMYPYFEKDVEALREKGYLTPEEEDVRFWQDLRTQGLEKLS